MRSVTGAAENTARAATEPTIVGFLSKILWSGPVSVTDSAKPKRAGMKEKTQQVWLQLPEVRVGVEAQRLADAQSRAQEQEAEQEHAVVPIPPGAEHLLKHVDESEPGQILGRLGQARDLLHGQQSRGDHHHHTDAGSEQGEARIGRRV